MAGRFKTFYSEEEVRGRISFNITSNYVKRGVLVIKVAPYSFLKSGKHMFQTENLVH